MAIIERRETYLLICTCDECGQNFSKTRNIPRALKADLHFCSNSCAGRYKFKNFSQCNQIENLTQHHDKYAKDIEYKAKIRAKKQKTCNIKFGSDSPLQNANIRQKCKETLRKNYGVENPLQSKEIFERVMKTCEMVYGNKYQIASKSTRRKIINALQAKCGSNSPAVKIKKIIENGQYVIDWLKEQTEPKPLRNQIYRAFAKDEISVEELERFLDNWRNHKTNLEFMAEQLLEVKHFNKTINSNKQTKKRYRPDFKLSDTVYVNTDGLYWHSEKVQEDKWYAYNLRKHFEENNLRILQFHENEIVTKPEVVKSIVNNSIGKTAKTIYARTCTIKSVSHKDACDFLDENHLMGNITARHVGLYSEAILVAIMSYKLIKSNLKIERFCSTVHTNVVGGFSKLLAHIIKQNSNIREIHNWVDLRYGTGGHLYNKGFVRSHESLGWKWTNGYQTFNRRQCRANMDARKLSEKQYAEEFGWYKIYDAGQRLFIKNVS